MQENLTESDGAGSGHRESLMISIPTAIVIAGALIALAVYASNREGDYQIPGDRPVIAEIDDTSKLENLRPITREDHIRGSLNAKVKIVEYSDLECPFCKRFHPSLQKAVDEYGSGEQLAWVYRHFPLDQLHPLKSRKESVATECANELGGNEAFWRFTDRFLELTPSNNQTDIDKVLPQIAREMSLDTKRFNDCLSSGKYDKRIQDDLDNATATGGNGTPWSIIISPSGKKYPISGAEPYEILKQTIDLALQEK